MDFYLYEVIILISLDDEKGNFMYVGGYINYVFGVVFMFDFLFEECIKIEDGCVCLFINVIIDSWAFNNFIECIVK